MNDLNYGYDFLYICEGAVGYYTKDYDILLNIIIDWGAFELTFPVGGLKPGGANSGFV